GVRALGFAFHAASGEVNRARVATARGDRVDARRRLDAARASFRALALPNAEAELSVAELELAVQLGAASELAAAVRRCRRALSRWPSPRAMELAGERLAL